ncbi:lytic transglycosylase domain-containing protein [Octadecabacter sp. CECT 8868]|uniref:transglycosylase SLT domain-containing protein n=1 Tax=Octadecabacter algicola TaxID=2909342 RepID=UPI001F341807|nr:transglycosylase SLT domain-containing protein [Octadecabacter algicola]MCF2904323.1 lytic transglycosylase domain-containing protein [Octadecabacter algicola]
MFALRTLLGGILAITMGTAALAEWPVGGPESETRPFSRADAVVLRANAAFERVEAARAALASFKPLSRPDYMLRYPVVISENPTQRPVMRTNYIPDARWDFKSGSDSWTRAALAALRSHGTRMEETVPRDIENWCPAYEDNPPHLRRAFWVGMMSALAKHESTYRPEAVGGPNLWYGLLQIYPDTARRYGCRATTGEALKDPEDNLSCAIRIMNVTVPRDNAIAVRDSRWRGVAADWGPMTRPSKIAEMSAWTRQQEYCEAPVNIGSIRPSARPQVQATLSTMNEG